jgi:hypothetical protein
MYILPLDEIYLIPNKTHNYFPTSKLTLDINDYISKNHLTTIIVIKTLY